MAEFERLQLAGRSRDALEIHKKTVKLQVNERFPKTFKTDAASTTDPDYFGEPAIETGIYSETGYKDDDPGVACNAPVDYAISKCVKQTTIGPSFTAGNGETAQLQKLDVLGFVVGDKPSLGQLAEFPAQASGADPIDPGVQGLGSVD